MEQICLQLPIIRGSLEMWPFSIYLVWYVCEQVWQKKIVWINLRLCPLAVVAFFGLLGCICSFIVFSTQVSRQKYKSKDIRKYKLKYKRHLPLLCHRILHTCEQTGFLKDLLKQGTVFFVGVTGGKSKFQTKSKRENQKAFNIPHVSLMCLYANYHWPNLLFRKAQS